MKIAKKQLRRIVKEELQKALNEDGHTDVASARRSMQLAIEDCEDILQYLRALPPEGDLPSWWMKKIAVSSAYLNGARDYLLTGGENVNELRIPPASVERDEIIIGQIKDDLEYAAQELSTRGYDDAADHIEMALSEI